MINILVTSRDKGSGKTAICAGLGKYLRNAGKKVGYLTPGTGDSSDAGFMKIALSLEESMDVLNPALSGKGNIKEAYTKISQGKDVVIIESDYQSAGDVAKALGAGVIVIETYAGKASDYKELEQLMLGVIINKVPRSRMEQVRSAARENVIGVLPEDRTLLASTMGELVESIQGEVVWGVEQSDELVENVMLGALTVDHGPEYYGRKANKMVVLRSDRPDMQMAAMETSTRCIVAAGDTPIRPIVLERAKEQNVPVIKVNNSSAAVVENIENILGRGKINQQNKLPRLVEMVEQNIDIKKIRKGLALPG